MRWTVYIILCTDKSLYTGITTDIERRVAQHKAHKGAKYFLGHKPKQVVYMESGHTRSSASQREAAIKKMKRPNKDRLIACKVNEIYKLKPALG